LSLFWQQQTTLAAFVDSEYSKGTFSARTLEAITPTLDPSYSKIDASWPEPDPPNNWATPNYQMSWSPLSGGTPATSFYSGTARTATLQVGSGTQTNQALTFTDVAVGSTHACGISRGTVYCWGTSAAGGLGLGTTTTTNVPKPVGGLMAGQQAVQVTAGTNFTCARVSTGAAYCWGEGSYGQLGRNSATDSNVPVLVSLSDVASISAGDVHACAVSGGKAFCWGRNNSRQLGDNTITQRNVPTQVYPTGLLAGRNVSEVSAGRIHSCAVADGLAFCWGTNTYGQLGTNNNTTYAVPTAVVTTGAAIGKVVSSISAGGNHTCAIMSGAAYCWGYNTSGQLGNNSTTASVVPVAVQTTVMSATVTAVSAGYNHSCAVADNNAYCWGDGTYTEIGDGGGQRSVPVLATGSLSARTVVAISAGSYTSCATGYTPAACWGRGTNGQIGNGASQNKSVPTDVLLDAPVCPDGSVRVGADCSLSEDTDYYFRLGYSIGSWVAPNSTWKKATTLSRTSVKPSLVSRTTNSITMDWPAPAEPQDSYAQYTLQRSLNSDGSDPSTLAVTGDQTFTDASGVPTVGFSKVIAGLDHSCGISDGQVYCWGRNNYGQLGIGTTDTGTHSTPTLVPALANMTATDIAAGDSFSCAVADGLVYCWGYNNYGQLGSGNYTTYSSPNEVVNQAGYTAVDVTAGSTHACAITAGGGAVWCWGRNNAGQLGNNSTLTSTSPVSANAGDLGTTESTAISAGTTHTCVIANSQAYCWGYNYYGQLGTGNNTNAMVARAVVTTGAMGSQQVKAISSGGNHTCAIAADNQAYCWGYDASGQLGNNATYANSSSPVAVATTLMSGTVTSIGAGANHTCAVADGAAYCWGLGTSGQLGNSSGTSTGVPVAVVTTATSPASAVQIAGGGVHSCAVFDGRPWCWGTGTYGRLGNGAATSYTYPQATTMNAMCARNTTLLGDGTCAMASGTTYYYRVKYTLDDGSTRTGSWVGIATS
jgi:alpha-tubulin suppressor-like RCC1 family protein